MYCVNGESRTRITPPVSERGDYSGLMLLHERDMRNRDCRGDGGSTAVDECTLESLKKHVLRTIPGCLVSNHLQSFCFIVPQIQYQDRMDWSLAGSSVPRIN